ncbi:carboxylesterase family protein [Streptomyces sp. NPDC090021]|uniref:carboxylesterase family protein n=1 Tax=Streptomyces sp. NPDC090021 TaxID=3365919 RepID=UPI00380432D2
MGSARFVTLSATFTHCAIRGGQTGVPARAPWGEARAVPDMRGVRRRCALLLPLVLLLVGTAAGPRGPVVDTDRGPVRGRTHGAYSTFGGIPFAAPPTGPRRWRPPEPAPAWEGVRDAGAPGSRLCAAARARVRRAGRVRGLPVPQRDRSGGPASSATTVGSVRPPRLPTGRVTVSA